MAESSPHSTPPPGAAEQRPPEVSLFWVDPETGVKCRARVDWLPDARSRVGGCSCPTSRRRQRGAVRVRQGCRRTYGYYGQQRALPRRHQGLGLDRDPAFLFVVVEKADPHLVNVGQFAERDDLILARAAVDHCRRLYASCTATDTWPGYGDGVNQLELPKWLHYSELAEALS
jgi:hypothetical protein